MSRIKLKIPEHWIFSTEIPVRITDLNYGNHLANDSLLSILHESRIRFLNSYNYSENDIEGIGIMMADAVIIYKAQGYYGDILTIQLAVDDISRKSCDLYYRVSNQTQKVIALCKTALVFFDFNTQKPVAIPQKFISKLQVAGQT